MSVVQMKIRFPLIKTKFNIDLESVYFVRTEEGQPGPKYIF